MRKPCRVPGQERCLRQGRSQKCINMTCVSLKNSAEALNQLGRPVVFVGDGIPVFRERMREVLRVPYTLAPSHRNRQSAACIAALGRVYYAQGRIVSGAEHVPEYLRLSQAERERAQSVPERQDE